MASITVQINDDLLRFAERVLVPAYSCSDTADLFSGMLTASLIKEEADYLDRLPLPEGFKLSDVADDEIPF